MVLAVGNAPTALVRLYELMEEGRIAPALIIGVPVGFVNVVASKELIMTGPAPTLWPGQKGRQQRGRRHLQRHSISDEVSDNMKIQMIGMDHSRAPVEIRERFSFTTAGAEAAMKTVCATPWGGGLHSPFHLQPDGALGQRQGTCGTARDSVRSEGSGPGGLPGIPGVPGGGRAVAYLLPWPAAFGP